MRTTTRKVDHPFAVPSAKKRKGKRKEQEKRLPNSKKKKKKKIRNETKMTERMRRRCNVP